MHYGTFGEAVDVADRSVVMGSRTARNIAIKAVNEGKKYVIWLDAAKKQVVATVDDSIEQCGIEETDNVKILYTSNESIPKEDQLARDAHGAYYISRYGTTLQEQILALEAGDSADAVLFSVGLLRYDSETDGFKKLPCKEIDGEYYAYSYNTVVIAGAAFVTSYLRKELQKRYPDLKTREPLYLKIQQMIDGNWTNTVPSVAEEKDPFGNKCEYDYQFWYNAVYYKPYSYIGDGIYEIPGHLVMPVDKPNLYDLDEEEMEPYSRNESLTKDIEDKAEYIKKAKKRKEELKKQKKKSTTEEADRLAGEISKLDEDLKNARKAKRRLEKMVSPEEDIIYGNTRLFPIIKALRER